MKLRGIDFGSVLGASGVQNFFGEGYPFHRFARLLFGLRFRGMTFVAKTTTLWERLGNMPLRGTQPRELLPRCIVVRPLKGVVLNAVGLSGPGAMELLLDGRWQARTEPFMISFMSVSEQVKDRMLELREFTRLLGRSLLCSSPWRGRIGLQVNFSCPNVGLDPAHLVDEVGEALDIASALGIPLVPKFSVLLPVEVAREIAQHPACDAICISNTIPWGQLSKVIDWKGLFGSDFSPLAHLGGGGLSGRPLQRLVSGWVGCAVWNAGITKPINAGGGILSLADAREMMDAGASSIFLGSIALLRPWRVRGIVRAFNRS